jgi:pimeloyl-ACP methyl ester carboxylesterase
MRRGTRRRVRRTAAMTVVGVGIGAAAGARQVARAQRAWDKAADPTGGRPMAMPDVEESTVRTDDGAELAVAVCGPETGPMVVLVHCWTGDRRVWGPVASRLAATHRVVLYDHRGHGRSTVGGAGLTLDALADDLRAVLDHVDARGAVVAGHSMGGMTAQAFAVRHPEVLRDRVAGLVLVGTACDGLGTGTAGLPPGAVSTAVTDALLRRPRVGRLLVRNAVGDVCATAHLDAVIETFVATPGHVRADLLRTMHAMDLSAGLAAVDLPVVILSGTKDQITPPARSRRMAEVLPQARLVALPGAGHMLPWEELDRVTETIAEVAAAVPAMQAPAV